MEADDKKEEEEENPLLVPLEEKAVLQEEQANLWFSKVRGVWGPRQTGSWHSLGEGWLKTPPSQDGFSGIEDDADEALEISQAQLLYESRRKGQPQPPPQPPRVKTESKPPCCQDEAPKEAEALSGTEAVSGPGEQERDDSSDSDSSNEDEER